MTTTAKKLVSGSAIRVMNYGFQVIAAFFMTPFIVHSLGERMYGVWLLVAGFLGYYGLLDLGLQSAVNRYLAEAIGKGDECGSNRIFNTAVMLYTFLGCVALVVTGVVIASTPFFIKDAEDVSLFRMLILIMGASSAVAFPIRAFMAVMTAQLRFGMLSALQMITLFLRTVSIALALVSGYKILAMAVITFCAGLPEIILIIYYTKKYSPFLHVFDRTHWNINMAKSLLGYSFFAFIIQLGDLMRFNIDAIIITAFVGLAAVSHYGIAAALCMYYMNLMISIMGVLQPVFSRQLGTSNLESMKKTFLFTSRLSLIAASFPAFCFLALGKPFILRWMGESFLDAYNCLAILAVAMLLDLSQMPSIGLLYGTSKHRFYALFNIIQGVLNVALSILLVQWWGITGVALSALLLMSIMKLVIQPIYVCRVTSIPYWEYVRTFGKTVLVVLGSLSIPLLLSINYARPDYLNLSAIGTLVALYYFLMVWMFALAPHERELFKSVIFHRDTKVRQPSASAILMGRDDNAG